MNRDWPPHATYRQSAGNLDWENFALRLSRNRRHPDIVHERSNFKAHTPNKHLADLRQHYVAILNTSEMRADAWFRITSNLTGTLTRQRSLQASIERSLDTKAKVQRNSTDQGSKTGLEIAHIEPAIDCSRCDRDCYIPAGSDASHRVAR